VVRRRAGARVAVIVVDSALSFFFFAIVKTHGHIVM
jgi:hypothetical protein